jgi:hypothetical protein
MFGRGALIASAGFLILASHVQRAHAAAQAEAAAGPPARQFALVIGNNEPPHSGLSRLRYADDDAVRWAVLFDALGATVEVLTELDRESQRLYGPLAFQTRPPTRAALGAAIGRLGAQIAAARAQGQRTVFYFVYAGHGDVEGGQSYLALANDRLSRADLGTVVLLPAGADMNHVIVDACRASFFIGNRGPGGERRPWQDSYFAPGTARLDNTGFLLASSSSGLSHEWEEFQGGVFSHEVRSGLLGAADVNGDGLVTYTELTGFVRMANQPVRNERFRPAIVSRAPTGTNDVLLDLRDARSGSLTIGPAPTGVHQMLEDRAGVRWADFHPGASVPVRLILPRPSWSADGFYLRSLAGSGEYAIPAGSDVRLADLAPQSPRALRRGALSDAFTHLFELPFDQAALDRLAFEPDLRTQVAAPPSTDLSRPPMTKMAGVGAVAAGGVSLGIAAALVVWASRLHSTADGASGVDRVAINEEIASRNRWATVTAIGGAALAVLGASLLMWRGHSANEPVPGP